jgi:hypothetical protein
VPYPRGIGLIVGIRILPPPDLIAWPATKNDVQIPIPIDIVKCSTSLNGHHGAIDYVFCPIGLIPSIPDDCWRLAALCDYKIIDAVTIYIQDQGCSLLRPAIWRWKPAILACNVCPLDWLGHCITSVDGKNRNKKPSSGKRLHRSLPYYAGQTHYGTCVALLIFPKTTFASAAVTIPLKLISFAL